MEELLEDFLSGKSLWSLNGINAVVDAFKLEKKYSEMDSKWIQCRKGNINTKENISEHSTTLKVSGDILNRKQK